MQIGPTSGDLGPRSIQWQPSPEQAVEAAGQASTEPRQAAVSDRSPRTKGPLGDVGSALLRSDLDAAAEAKAPASTPRTFSEVLEALSRGGDLAAAEQAAARLLAEGALSPEQIEQLAAAHAQALSRCAVEQKVEQAGELEQFAQQHGLGTTCTEQCEPFLQRAFALLDDGALPDPVQKRLAHTTADVGLAVGRKQIEQAGASVEPEAALATGSEQAAQLAQMLQAAVAQRSADKVPAPVYRAAADLLASGLLQPEAAHGLADVLAIALRQRAVLHWNRRATDIGSEQARELIPQMTPEQTTRLQQEIVRTITSGVVDPEKLEAVARTNLVLQGRTGGGRRPIVAAD